MFKFLQNIDRKGYKPVFGGLGIFKFIGPGLLVTVGFIDPGNWASDLAAGSDYGYALLWVVTLSTIMLVILQHNVAHLGIATGLCLSEAATIYIKPRYSNILLSSAMLASISTSLADSRSSSTARERVRPGAPRLVHLEGRALGTGNAGDPGAAVRGDRYAEPHRRGTPGDRRAVRALVRSAEVELSGRWRCCRPRRAACAGTRSSVPTRGSPRLRCSARRWCRC